MRIKKHYTLSALLILSAFVTMAQPNMSEDGLKEKRFYIKAYGGYGLFTPGSYRVESRNQYVYQSGTAGVVPILRDTTLVSLGKKGIGGGLRIGGGIGINLSDFLNVGVDAEYFKGNTLVNNSSNKNAFSNSLTRSTIDYKVISITPHILFKARSTPNYYIYNRVGILLSLPFTLNYSGSDSLAYEPKIQTVTSGSGSTQTTTTYRTLSKSVKTYSGGYKVPLSIGLNVALGVQFKIAGNLRGFGELFANYSVLSPQSYHETSKRTASGSVTETTTPGNKTTITNVITTYDLDTDITYKKDGALTYKYENVKPSTISNIPSGTTTQNFYNLSSQTTSSINRNMNAIGINIGIAYKL